MFFWAITVLLSRTGWGCATHIAGTSTAGSPAWRKLGRCQERRILNPRNSTDFLKFLSLHYFDQWNPSCEGGAGRKASAMCYRECRWIFRGGGVFGFFLVFCVLLVLVSSAIINLCLHRHVERQSIPSAVELETWRPHCAILACWLVCPAIHNLPSAQRSPREHCFHQERVK